MLANGAAFAYRNTAADSDGIRVAARGKLYGGRTVIRHVAIVELSSDCAPDDRDALVAQIRALGATIPTVAAMTVGIARDSSGQALNRICLVSDHRTWDDLDTYLRDPAHQAVAREVGRLRESAMGADFEVR
ncbi:Dabb family protein (plasmid) [Nocardioides sp. R1-1]|uniref:Dabb family protein n=1 Tax=Nocardioides sp. R1-1 TaxID=3383502 RepID=UPI0038CFDCDC